MVTTGSAAAGQPRTSARADELADGNERAIAVTGVFVVLMVDVVVITVTSAARSCTGPGSKSADGVGFALAQLLSAWQP